MPGILQNHYIFLKGMLSLWGGKSFGTMHLTDSVVLEKDNLAEFHNGFNACDFYFHTKL